MNTHENLSRTDDNLKQSSDRFFGLTFFVVFLIIALWPQSKDSTASEPASLRTGS